MDGDLQARTGYPVRVDRRIYEGTEVERVARTPIAEMLLIEKASQMRWAEVSELNRTGAKFAATRTDTVLSKDVGQQGA